MKVEVTYPLSKEQKSFFVETNCNITVKQAIQQSQILYKYLELGKLEDLNVGVYSKVVSLNDHVRDNDRIEIYRKLTIDPKKARMRRAEMQNKKH